MVRAFIIMLVLPTFLAGQATADDGKRTSETVTAVLRKPLPPEDIRHSVGPRHITIEGPTYTYAVNKTTGAISSLEVRRERQVVVKFEEAADIIIDDYSLASRVNTGNTKVVRHSTEKVVLKTQGILKLSDSPRPDIDYRLTNVFYNDGVVVSELKLQPKQDILILEGIRYRLQAQGLFAYYLHKEINRHGHGSPHGPLPDAGKAVTFGTLTSCLQVFSPEAALAIFTDSGAIHLAGNGLDTAAIDVNCSSPDLISTTLTQQLVKISPEETPYILKAGTELTLRVGISIAPNRVPHTRRRDLRMFIWIGDDKHPYPTDKQIEDVAQLGFTLFQMHRLGNAGEPRPPAKELDRVIKTVHDNGMLFLWTANADLMYACAQGVQDLRAGGKWPLWQGFNYGGRYTAPMDAYCDLLATCLAAPNGLAEYRLSCIERMMDRHKVDGMYIDDNLAYGNCTLTEEHNHPRKPYDSLIELHEMNWRRRQLLRKSCQHAVLVDHCSSGLVLPVICDFDVHLFGEGYGFSSLEAYWNLFGSVGSMHAQGSIWAGDSETSRCAAKLVYNYDLLTGGGQYTYLDWRLYPKRFPYASGVAENEVLFVRTYNLAQYYFGMYESTPHHFATAADIFATTKPLTYATVYHNRIWNDYLIPIANMAEEAKETSLRIFRPDELCLSAESDYILYDLNGRTTRAGKGHMLAKALTNISVPRQGLRLLYLREIPDRAPYHLWGGKRIAETWDAKKRRLSIRVHGPKELRDLVLIGVGHQGVREVKVDGKPSAFLFDPSSKLVHGRVTFAQNPVTIEVICSEDAATRLPVKPLTADRLTTDFHGNSGVARRQKPPPTTGDKSESRQVPDYKWVNVTRRAQFAARDGAGALVFKGKMWLIGGWNPPDKVNFPKYCNNEVWSSTDGHTWFLDKPNSFTKSDYDPNRDWEGRHTAGYVVHGDKMWIVGGDPLQGHYQNDVWNSADGKTWKCVNRNVPWAPRALHCTVAFKNKIWVMGGQTTPQFAPAENRFYNDIWNSSDGMAWAKVTQQEPHWPPRGMIGGSVVFKDRMWILGGGTYDTPEFPKRTFYNDVWSSPDGMNWTRHLDHAPWHPRQYHEVAVFDGHMWVLEGWNQTNRNDVWYSADGINWRELPNTPWKPRHAASVFVYDNALWMIAGNNMEPDVWKLQRTSAADR